MKLLVSRPAGVNLVVDKIGREVEHPRSLLAFWFVDYVPWIATFTTSATRLGSNVTFVGCGSTLLLGKSPRLHKKVMKKEESLGKKYIDICKKAKEMQSFALHTMSLSARVRVLFAGKSISFLYHLFEIDRVFTGVGSVAKRGKQ